MAESAKCTECGKTLVEGAAFCAFCAAPVAGAEKTTASGTTRDIRPVTVRPSRIDIPEAGNRYELKDPLGRGGMGEVYLAEDRLLNRHLAMKILHPHMSVTSDRARFIEEAMVASQLESRKGIVPILDLAKLEDGRIFLTMELLEGRNLQQVLDAHTSGSEPLPQKRLIAILLSVTRAIASAHEKGVIHRDIKPTNIMVDDLWTTTVVDWGLAKLVSDTRKDQRAQRALETQDGSLLGTPAYMPPEAVRGDTEDVDMRSDVYALGVILFVMLTDRLPYDGGNEFEILRKRLTEAPPKPSAVASSKVSPELESICLKAMADKREDRYPTAKEMAVDLQDYLDGVSEAERREAEAKLRLKEASVHISQYHSLQERYTNEESRLRDVEASIPLQASRSQRAPIYEIANSLPEIRRLRDQAFDRAVKTLGAAISFDPENPEVKASFADLYLERLLDAEARGQQDAVSFFRSQVEQYDDGSRQAILQGDGSVTFSTDPPGASVAIYRYVERNRYLEEELVDEPGVTPVSSPLPMGSYVAVLTKEGHAPARYPFLVGRGEKVKVHFPLLPQDEVGDDDEWAYIPPMTVKFTLDPIAAAYAAKERTVALGGFCIARRQITMAQYLEFLNDLASTDPTGAQARSPRETAHEGYHWLLNDGRFELPTEPDADGHIHDPDWPIMDISWYDAVAFCEWRSKRDGREYRLATEDQRELAARGADGRFFPWGDHDEPSFYSCMRATPSRVTEYQTDRSPFHVFGLAGNAPDWLDSWIDEAKGTVATRGNLYRGSGVHSHAATRSYYYAQDPRCGAGIRLVHIPKRLQRQA